MDDNVYLMVVDIRESNNLEKTVNNIFFLIIVIYNMIKHNGYLFNSEHRQVISSRYCKIKMLRKIKGFLCLQQDRVIYLDTTNSNF